MNTINSMAAAEKAAVRGGGTVICAAVVGPVAGMIMPRSDALVRSLPRVLLRTSSR